MHLRPFGSYPSKWTDLKVDLPELPADIKAGIIQQLQGQVEHTHGRGVVLPDADVAVNTLHAPDQSCNNIRN